MPTGPGWYDDPQAPGKERWWDGHRWTRHVRHDVPDIPPAPWADIAHPVIDSTPPRRPGSLALAVASGILGVALVTGIGASTTLAGIRHGGEAGPVVAPPGGEGPPVLPLYSCTDVAATTLAMARRDGDLAIEGWATPAAVVADHQPIRSLPPEGELHLVIECVADARFTDGRVAPVGMSYAVDSGATVWVTYGEL